MEWETVKLRVEENIGTITLHRPQQFNSLNNQLGDDLVEALDCCNNHDDVRVMVITGAGKAFCSGGDLTMARSYMDSDPAAFTRQTTKRLNRAIIEIRRSAKPVIASINGSVGGGGMGLAACCDYKIASSQAKFKQAYTACGLAPDGAFMLFMTLLTGWAKTNEMLFMDPAIDAKDAQRIGLINECVEPDQLEARTRDVALKLAAGPLRAYAIGKRSLNEAVLIFLERQLEIERNAVIESSQTEDYLIGLRAFFEKTIPVFTGK